MDEKDIRKMPDNKQFLYNFKKLFNLTFSILDKMDIKDYSWGGGTALYFVWRYPRESKDIDIFLNNIQLLTGLSPRLNDYAEEISGGNYVEQSNFVKLITEYGDIDFIAAPFLSKNPCINVTIWGRKVLTQRPIEIIAKKFFYRYDSLKQRDIIDFHYFLIDATLEERMEMHTILHSRIENIKIFLNALSDKTGQEIKDYIEILNDFLQEKSYVTERGNREAYQSGH